MTAPKRKHRRVRSSWTGCGCPAGTRKVSTCSTKNGKKYCRGRGWGCLGTGKSQKGKSAPRFFPAVCDSGARQLPPSEVKLLVAETPSYKRQRRATVVVVEKSPLRRLR